jgi:hypothetical protein
VVRATGESPPTIASRDAEHLAPLYFRNVHVEWISQPTNGVACHLAAQDRVDDLVNGRQTSGVIELSEQTVIEQ